MASFDENGKYIKTNWKAGDKITATKLNKIEESIEAVNDNDISRHVEADARLDALEAKDVAHDKEFTNVKNLIADNKAAAELGDYAINSRMQFLEEELNDGIEEVHNVAETVDGKIATAEANMAAQVNQGKADMEAQVNQGKADMEAMVAEVEADLEGLHAKDEELSTQLAQNVNDVELLKSEYVNVLEFGAIGDGVNDDTEAFENAINTGKMVYVPITGKLYKINRTLRPLQYQIIYGDASITKNNLQGGIKYGITTDIEDLTIFDLSNKRITLRNIRLFGNNSGIAVENVNDSRLYDVEMSKFNIAIKKVEGSSELFGTKAYDNRIGLQFAVDSRIISCHFQGNSSYGIYLPSGSGDLHIIGSKFDWNLTHNMYLSGAKKVMIIGCVIDRATQYGISMHNCDNISISSNLLRRNYIDDTDMQSRCQIYCKNCTNISLSDNQIIKSIGSDNAEDTVEYPFGTVLIENSHYINTSGNTLKGVSRDKIAFAGECSNIFLNDKMPHIINLSNSVLNGRCLISGQLKTLNFDSKSQVDMTIGTSYVLGTNTLLASNNAIGYISGYTYANKNTLISYRISNTGEIKITPLNEVKTSDPLIFTVTYY